MKTSVEGQIVDISNSQGLTDQEKAEHLIYKLMPYEWVTRQVITSLHKIEDTMRTVISFLLIFNLLSSNVQAGEPIGTINPIPQPETGVTSPSTSDTTNIPNVNEPPSAISASIPEGAAAGVAPGRSFYVSTTGSDSANGSQTSPWQNIAHAVSQLRAGDTLYINEGTYRGARGNFTASGTADAPIVIQGIGNVVIDGNPGDTRQSGTPANGNMKIFFTNGQDYIEIRNVKVQNARSAVEINSGSSNILVDGLISDRNDFAVLVDGGTDSIIRNVVATNSRNSFRTQNGATRNILFENIETYGSKDIWGGYNINTTYKNGDGFILEEGSNITVRNAKSYDHWDAGFDMKAANVLIENVEVWGNKNNFKNWGPSTTVRNALVRNARYDAQDAVSGEGWGVNARTGSITFINSTFVDNTAGDVRIDEQGPPSRVTLQNSIVARTISGGSVFRRDSGAAQFTDQNNVWYAPARDPEFSPSSSSVWVNPQFVNWAGKDFHLQPGSPATGKGYTYSGPVPVDDVAPIINVVTSSSVTSNGATINWTTNELSDSQVDYRAVGSSNWTTTPISSSMVTNHAVLLSGLSASTAYEYRVRSKDPSGNQSAEQSISRFTTLNPPPPDTSVPVISSVSSGNVSSTGATIAWTTNEVSDSQIEYRVQLGSGAALQLNGDYNGDGAVDLADSVIWRKTLGSTTQLAADGNQNGVIDQGDRDVWRANFGLTTGTGAAANEWITTNVNSSLVTNHSMALTGLAANTTYEFRVKSKDQAGNLAVQNAISTFTTLAPISNSDFVGVTNGATVSGTVNISPNLNKLTGVRKVAYYLNGSQSGKVYQSPFTWGGLTGDGIQGFDTKTLANGTYSLGMVYTDGTGDHDAQQISFVVNNSVSNPNPTDTVPPVIVGVNSNNVSATGATVVWTTNEVSNSSVEYRVQGETNWLSTNVDSLVLNHSVALSGLTANTVYEYRVRSIDAAGNFTGQQTISTFTTSEVSTPQPTGNFVGITNGATVSGTVNIGPDLTKLTNVKKVAYYLNGSQSGKVYQAPFFWGGVTGSGLNGFDTRTLANGTYTLGMVYTDLTGDHGISISFTVNN